MKRALLLLTLFACRGGRAGAHDGRVEVARVGTESLYADQVKAQLQLMRFSLGPLDKDDGDDPEMSDLQPTKALKHRVLDSLIDKTLLLQEAARRHVTVPNEDATRMFARVKDDYPAEKFDRLLEDRHLTPEALQHRMHDQLVIGKLLRDEVYARIPLTDADAQAYFKQHPELGKQDERVHCSQIVQVSEAEAEKVKEQITKGMPFEEAASRYSIAPEAARGGDLGNFARGVMPTVIEEECFSLAVGKVSDVVASEDGAPVPDDEKNGANRLYHLFHVIEKKAAVTLTFEQAKEQVEAKLKNERQQKAEREFLDHLRTSTPIKIDDNKLESVI